MDDKGMDLKLMDDKDFHSSRFYAFIDGSCEGVFALRTNATETSSSVLRAHLSPPGHVLVVEQTGQTVDSQLDAMRVLVAAAPNKAKPFARRLLDFRNTFVYPPYIPVELLSTQQRLEVTEVL